jgi:hypothetical protein
MKEILQTYKLPELKKMVRATNITGYSKLKKDELIKLMMRPEHADRFKSIKPKSARVPPVDKSKKIKKKGLQKGIDDFKKKQKLDGSVLKEVLGLKEEDVEDLFKPMPKSSKKKEVPKKKEEPKKETPPPKKKKPELPIVVKKNKELKKLFEGKSVKTMKVILEITNDLIELFESDSAKDVMQGRIQLDEEDDLVKETLSILEPQLYLKNISAESDPTGKKQKQEEEREKSPKKKSQANKTKKQQ